MKYYVWVCNECGASQYTGAVSEDDISELSCSECGGWDWHKEEENDPTN